MKVLDIREYRGKNIYSHYPVVKITLDLEDLTGIWSDNIPGFAERLCGIMPSLAEHYCTRGKREGFLERLREGTLLGHVIEHVSLELQALAGHKVKYGKTLATSSPGIFDIVIEAEIIETGIKAFQGALEIVRALIGNEGCNLPEILAQMADSIVDNGYGPSTLAILQECGKRDIPFLPLGDGSLFQLGYGAFQRRMQATISGFTSCIGADIAGNKELTKKLLAESGIPVPPGVLVSNAESALGAFEKLGPAVVIKPYNGNQGKGVSLNLIKAEEIEQAFSLAKQYSEKIIVERYLPGRHFRLLVINGEVVAAAERIPAHVKGDGSRSVKELTDQINSDPLRGKGHESPLTKIDLDEQALGVLAKQGLTPDMAPKPGQVVFLRESANLSTGGTAIDVTDWVNPQQKKIAQRAARVVGLDVAGIDLVCKDITKPLTAGQGAIIEVNAAPGFRMHLYPSSGEARDVAGSFVKHLFPSGMTARIPIISVTGTNGKTTTTRLIAYILRKWGKCVGCTTTGGTFVGNECFFRGDATGPLSAQTILRDPRVEVAVLETARGGIIRAGLGYDKAKVGVVTNISEDHLGNGGVEDLEQLAMIKALVVEALEKGGMAVLNADDPWSREISQRVREDIVLFSVSEENILIRRHLGKGQKAFFVRKGTLIFAEGESWQKILPLKEVAIGMKGLAGFNIANALAAAAACSGIGVPFSLIKEGLKTFGLEKNHNPGRCQFFYIGEVKVILDYGHNAAAFKSVLSVARRLKGQRVLGVIGVPGDRRDEDIRHAGAVAAQFLDYCLIKEDRDLRGRKPGETALLLLQGLKEHGFAAEQAEVVLNEVQAVVRALSNSKPGDVVVVFYEELAPLQKLLEDLEKLHNKKPCLNKVLSGEEEIFGIV